MEYEDKITNAADTESSEAAVDTTAQEIASPADDKTAGEVSEGRQAESVNEQTATAKPVQSAEDNAKFANIRRKAEADAKAKYDAFIAKHYAGKKGSDGKAITTMEAAAAYEDEQSMARFKQNYLDMGLDEGEAARMASTMQMAERFVESQKAVQDAQLEQGINQEMSKQLNALQRAFPDCGITDEESLAKDPAVLEYAIKLGGDLVKAYRLAHYDDIVSGKFAAARQDAINSARSGQHQKGISTGAAGKSLKEVPASTMATYRMFYPELSAEQIREKYNRDIN